MSYLQIVVIYFIYICIMYLFIYLFNLFNALLQNKNEHRANF